MQHIFKGGITLSNGGYSTDCHVDLHAVFYRIAGTQGPPPTKPRPSKRPISKTKYDSKRRDNSGGVKSRGRLGRENRAVCYFTDFAPFYSMNTWYRLRQVKVPRGSRWGSIDSRKKAKTISR